MATAMMITNIELDIIPEVLGLLNGNHALKVFKFSSMGGNVTDTVIRRNAHLLAMKSSLVSPVS